MFLRTTAEQKQLVDEISALSGIQKEVIREVWEFTAIRWAEVFLRNPEKPARLDIPHMGTVMVRYMGDQVEDTGEISTEVEAFISLTPQFKKLIGDLVDEKENIIEAVLEKKINTAILTSADGED